MVEPLRKEEVASERERAFKLASLDQTLGQPTQGALPRSSREPAYQAYRALQLGFVAAPVIAGLDKFSQVLVNWDQYLAPVIPRILGVSAHTFMMGVGLVEIVAGIGVALKPRIFGYVVSGWLGGIIVNLLMTGQYFDIALRDLGLSIGAFSLARLSQYFDRPRRTI